MGNIRQCDLVGRGVSLRWALGFQKPISFPGSSLILMVVSQNEATASALCLPANMLPTTIVTDKYSETGSLNKLFYKLLGGSVLL